MGAVGDHQSEEEQEQEQEQEDEFMRQGIAETHEYRLESAKEAKSRAEAFRLNRRYVKRKRKAKMPKTVDNELFQRLRQLLGIPKYDADLIRQSAIETMRKSHAKEGTNEDGEDAFSENEGQVNSPINWEKAAASDLGNKETTSSIPPEESVSEEECLLPPSKKGKGVVLEKTCHDDVFSDEELVLLEENAASGSKKDRVLETDSSGEDDLFPKTTEAPPASAHKANLEGKKESKLDAEPRPTFPLTPEQKNIGAYVLDEEEGIRVPVPINRFLRDYQREGVRFFYRSYKENRGGLLGDDMGLGKTIQVIAFLSAIMQKTGARAKDEYRRINAVRAGRSSSGRQKGDEVWPTSLIICPSSVIGNWQNELDTWGYFEHAQLSKESLNDFERGRLDILLTSHETAKLHIESLKAQAFSCVFIDECHKVKNPASQIRKAMCSFACQRRFGLTGTAIQNNIGEMWTILDWSNPERFGSLQHWMQLVAEPLSWGQMFGDRPILLARARLVAEALVNNLLPQFFLRRTKDLIQHQLPKKFDNIVFCSLTPLQIATYQKILEEPECLAIREANDPCDCGELDEEGLPYRKRYCCFQDQAKERRKYMFRYLHLLQSCSNHLALTFPDPVDNISILDSATNVRETDRERKVRYIRQLDTVQRLFPNDWYSKKNDALNGFREDFCGKWIVLKDLMKEWKKSGSKLLLFTANTRLLDWLASFVEMQGYQYLRLDGSTPQKKRQGLVDTFNQQADVFVFLISTTAGGTGLNLTGANKVVVFDPNWNPAHDLQAMDRAYRFGQVRDVSVYRLVGKGSLEEVIYDRQLYKQQMGRVGYEASKERRYFTREDISGSRSLFELHETSLGKTQGMIQACDLNEATFALEMFRKEQGLTESSAIGKKRSHLTVDGIEQLSSASQSYKKSHEEEGSDQRREREQGILTRSGVQYTHLNDELLGGSKTEEAMFKDALERARNALDKRASPLSLNQSNDRKGSTSVGAWPPRRLMENEKKEMEMEGLNGKSEGEKSLQEDGIRIESKPNFTLAMVAEVMQLSVGEAAKKVNRMSDEEQSDIFALTEEKLKGGLGRSADSQKGRRGVTRVDDDEKEDEEEEMVLL